MTFEKLQNNCFVICPIGEPKTDIRKRSDKVYKFIIEPIIKELEGYNLEVIRADKISSPGVITDQIIQHLLEDILVVADLSDSNPNVFYELAIRHVTKLPFIQIIQEGEKIPFDNFNMRTIPYGFDIETVDETKRNMLEQIKNALEDPIKITTPISISTDLKLLEESGNPLEKINAEILSNISDLRSLVVEMVRKTTGGPIASNVIHFEELLEIMTMLSHKLLEIENQKEKSYEDFDGMWDLLEHLLIIIEMFAKETDSTFGLTSHFKKRFKKLRQLRRRQSIIPDFP
jgi:hypothetical protein